MDYYQILELDYNATLRDINVQYGVLALKYHPKISKLNPSKAYQNFCRVAESYEVLSNKKMKAFYDEFGEVKLKQGIFINEKLRKEQERLEREEAARQIQISWNYRQKVQKREQDQAATAIQKQWKSRQKIKITKMQEEQNKAASLIQKKYRRRLAQNADFQEQQERSLAARKIQGQWKKRQSIRHKEEDQAATKIQGQWKRKQALKKEKLLEEQNQAATSIQKSWKRKQKREQDKAATAIQKQWRKKQENPVRKKKAEQLKAKKEALDKEQNDAASMIQAQWKKKQSRKQDKTESSEESEEDEFFMVFKGGYHFSGEPEKIFETFFGTDDPFSILNDQSKENLKDMLGHSLDQVSKYIGNNKPKDLLVNVPCTLKELYNGVSKKVTYKRQILNKDGRTTRNVTEIKNFTVKPGYSKETEITYEQQGHQIAGQVSSNLIFQIKTIPQQKYVRMCDDLIYTATISLADALCVKPIRLETLDGRIIKVSMDQIITPKTVKIVQNEGMPIFNPYDEADLEQVVRGNLQIRFRIKFPTALNTDQQNLLAEALC